MDEKLWELLMPVMFSRMDRYAEMIGYPTAVMNAVAENVQVYSDSVKWDSPEEMEHDLIRQIQYQTTHECLRYKRAHAGELLSRMAGAEARIPQEKLNRFDTETLADAWLSLNDKERQLLRMRFGTDDGTCKTPEDVACILNISRARVRQTERTFFHSLTRGCVFSPLTSDRRK